MILDKHYAVVVRPKYPTAEPQKFILTEFGWAYCQKMHEAGHIVILEAWHITTGKCVSN